MNLTHSLFNAGLARLSSPQIFLAAFAVAKSLIFIVQSPLLMIRQTITALVENQSSYQKVKTFFIKTTLLITLLLGLLVYSGGAKYLLFQVMGVKGQVLEEALNILRFLVFFPAVVALRSFVQGVLIKFRQTPILTSATIARVIFVAGFVVLIDYLSFFSGAFIAAAMFFSALLVEGGVVWLAARSRLGKISLALAREFKNEEYHINNKFILAFFWPLLLTSLINSLARPIINMGLARSLEPTVALATYSVAWDLGLVFLNTFVMFHQVPINFIDFNDERTIKGVRKFSLILGLLVTSVMILLSFTDLGLYLLRHLIGVSREISLKAVLVLRWMVLLPLIMVAREYQWGILMKLHQTRYMSRGRMINLLSLTLSVLIFARFPLENPAVGGIIAIIVGEGLELSYLFLLATKKGKYLREA